MTAAITLGEIAKRVGGQLVGDAEIAIEGIGSLTEAEPGQISWAQDNRSIDELSACRASAFLVTEKFRDAPQPHVMCEDIEAAVADVLDAFAAPLPSPPVGVDETARIAPSARLGSGVAVGPFVVIADGAEIGDQTILYAGVHVGSHVKVGRHCRIWNHVVIRERCIIGDHVQIHPQTVIGADGFGYIYRDGAHRKMTHLGDVIIGDHVEIGAGCCIDRAKVGSTRIETGSKIDNLVQVAHNVTVGAHSILCAQAGVAGSAKLGNAVVLGGQVGIRDNIVLNDGVMVGACSCVPHDVPAGVRVAGVPALEARQFLRINAAYKRLPELVERVRELSSRIEKLEASADDQAGRGDGGSGAVHR